MVDGPDHIRGRRAQNVRLATEVMSYAEVRDGGETARPGTSDAGARTCSGCPFAQKAGKGRFDSCRLQVAESYISL